VKDKALSLVRLTIDSHALTVFAARHKLLDDDLGYAMHLAMRRRLGNAGPQPFRRMLDTDPVSSKGIETILAYSSDVDKLKASFDSYPVADSEGISKFLFDQSGVRDQRCASHESRKVK